MHPELDTSVFMLCALLCIPAIERRFIFCCDDQQKKRSALFYFLIETQKKVAITVTSAEGM